MSEKQVSWEEAFSEREKNILENLAVRILTSDFPLENTRQANIYCLAAIVAGLAAIYEAGKRREYG